MAATQAARGMVVRRWLPVVGEGSGIWWGAGALVAFGVVAVAAPIIAPYNPAAINLTNTVAGASPAHLLGTDQLGRDVLSRLIYGSRTSLLGPMIVVAGSAAVAVPISLIASYRRGLADSILARVWDAMFGFPTLLLAIAVVATFGPGFWTATVAVTVIYVPLLARVVRGAVLVEREKGYVEACRLQGYSDARIAFCHVLPNIGGLIGAQAALNFGYAMLDLAGLTFLGFAVQPPTPDWGAMLADGQSSLVQHAYLEVVSTSITIMVAVLACNSFGYALAKRARGGR